MKRAIISTLLAAATSSALASVEVRELAVTIHNNSSHPIECHFDNSDAVVNVPPHSYKVTYYGRSGMHCKAVTPWAEDHNMTVNQLKDNILSNNILQQSGNNAFTYPGN